jgi:predicted RNase H-like HicB family nuclease
MKRTLKTFQLDYWKDDQWYVGRLREIPGVVSQGATLKELEENIQDAYRLVMTERRMARHPKAKTKVIAVPA